MPQPKPFRPQSLVKVIRALSNEKRLQIMEWLLDPKEHFPPQEFGDLEQDGVCVGHITKKVGLRQPTVTIHLRVLTDAGLLQSSKIQNWVLYKPNTKTLTLALDTLSEKFSRPVNAQS
jgi:ArsR family transcriptional regulator